ncbi:MAG: hypothetical protein AB7P08_01575 [Burkholderiales bacterium]
MARPAAARAQRQGGSGWLELGVSAVVVSVLAALLLAALLAQQALAEKATVELTILNLRTGLRLAVAELIIAGREREVASLAGANPVRWLERPPEGYLGEIDTPEDPARMPGGAWYFDRGRRELVYRVSHDGGFETLPGEPAVVRLQVALERGSARKEALLGVVLRVNNRYNWR